MPQQNTKTQTTKAQSFIGKLNLIQKTDRQLVKRLKAKNELLERYRR